MRFICWHTYIVRFTVSLFLNTLSVSCQHCLTCHYPYRAHSLQRCNTRELHESRYFVRIQGTPPSICTGTAFWIYTLHKYSRTFYVLLQEHFNRPTLWNVSFSMTVAVVTCRYRITSSSWRIRAFLHSYCFPLLHLRHSTDVYCLIFLLRTLTFNVL
jgi:hypothetical protein